MEKFSGFVKKNYYYIITTILTLVCGVLALFTTKYREYLKVVLMLIILDLILIYIPNKFGEKINKLLAIVLLIFSPVIYFQIAEIFYHKIIFTSYSSLKFKLNILLYALIVVLVYLIANNIKLTLYIVSAIVGIYTTANWYVYEFRGIPILATDVASAKTAANVASNYSYYPTLNMLAAWLVILGFVVVVHKINLPNKMKMKWQPRIAMAVVYAVILAVFVNQFYNTDKTTENKLIVSVWNPQRSFNNTGTLLSFMLTTKYLKVDKPEGYSLEAVEEIAQKYTSDTTTSNSDGIKPNVIAIMDEAFADLQLAGEFQTSEDYMPFVRSLSENTVKGTLYMSVFGGNTANSEFEFLTGNTLGFMPLRCVPYQQYVKDNLPSLTYTLKSSGYVGNNAMHPYKASGWGRPVVYPRLGFEDFISIEDFADDTEKVRKYISDSAHFDRIIEEYENTRKESDDPFYIFNVTIQNHGGYDADYDSLERTIKITDEHMNDEAERYINLIKKSDDALKELVEYFKNIEEPTVIVFFGDHQPSVTNSFYNSIMKKAEGMSSEEYDMTKYKVPFLIWANYDIEEKEYEMLSANYLSSVLLDTIDGNMTGYNKFLLEMSETIPVITANGFADKDGNFYSRGDKSPYDELMQEYNILEYNNLFDYKNRYSEFFFLSE